MTEHPDTQAHDDLPTPPPGTHRTVDTYDRRSVIVAAILIFAAIGLGALAVAVLADPGTPVTKEADGPPRSITKPNSGEKPATSGDRGGWEQLVLFGLILSSVLIIALLAWRTGGPKARASREAWKAAGRSGHDGALP